MDHNTKIDKIICIILSIFVLCVLIFLFFHVFFRKASLPSDIDAAADTENAQINEIYPDDLLPKKIFIGQKAPTVYFQMPDGNPVSIDALAASSPEGLWITISAGAEQDQEHIEAVRSLSSANKIMSFTVVKQVPDKDIDFYLSDPEETCRLEWGVEAFPADIILDPQGNVLECHAGRLKPGEAEGMLKRVREGRAAVNFAFIEHVMSDGNGGFYTSTAQNGEFPSGKDILSESQGLVMMYALNADDPELFRKTWTFTKEHLLKNDLAAWYVNSDDKPANVNAFLDDLRIWFALYKAETKFDKSYASEADAMLKAVKSRCLDLKKRPVDFAYLSGSERADIISLHYLDLEAIQAMKEADPDFGPVYDSALNILLDGRISDEFPLYYKNYDYSTRSYDPGSLNTAEALYTFWNMSRAGMLPKESLCWLKEKMQSGGLAARYNINGEVVLGYNYDSTAVYALAALTAMEAGDDELFGMALRRMERKLILDADDEFFGAYTQKGAVIYSFDQLMPLLVNASVDRYLIGKASGNGKQ